MNNKKIILSIIASLLTIIIILGTCSILIYNNTKTWNYKIIYKTNKDEKSIIYKTKENKIIVVKETQPICIQEPCNMIKTETTINFNKKNTKKINNYINNLFKGKIINTTTIDINKITNKEKNILKSIIENNESLLEKSKDTIYTIITDNKWKTMQNDGGSYNSIYYKINIDTNEIIKKEEIYKANLGGTPKKDTNKIYDKKVDDELINNIKEMIDTTILEEDINNDNNYNFYTIKDTKTSKKIYNTNKINEINTILNNIDNYIEKNPLLITKTYSNFAWSVSFKGSAIFENGTIYNWEFKGNNKEYSEYIKGYNIDTTEGMEKFILEKGSKSNNKISTKKLNNINKYIKNISSNNIKLKESCHGADMGTYRVNIYTNEEKILINETGDCDKTNNSSDIKNLLKILK